MEFTRIAAFAFTCSFLLTSIPLHAATTKTNVIFIIADDMNKAMPAYGMTLVKTPNIDRLAARAVRFDRAYCQYPVCSPSRVSFLSGLRPEQTEKYGNEGPSRTPALKDAVFMPQYFQANNYFTARLGKVFHIGQDVPECWNVTEEGTPNNKVIYQPGEEKELGLTDNITARHKLKGGGGEGSSSYILNGGKDKLIDVHNGARAAELINQNSNKDKPLFLVCGFRRPHLPHIAPEEFFNLYPAEKMPLPESGGPKIPGIKTPVSDDDSREGLRGYIACVTFMDEQLGKVLDAMDANHLWDNSVVVFIGDNGYLLGSRGGWWGKNVLYEEAASPAMLVAAPGKAAGVACRRPVEFIDLYPTLADLCGLPAPTKAEGRSFTPLLTDPKAAWDHPAYTMIATKGNPDGLSVSTERFRYLENPNGSVELFDVQADPKEWEDLSKKTEYAADFAAMKKLADDYKAKYRK